MAVHSANRLARKAPLGRLLALVFALLLGVGIGGALTSTSACEPTHHSAPSAAVGAPIMAAAEAGDSAAVAWPATYTPAPTVHGTPAPEPKSSGERPCHGEGGACCCPTACAGVIVLTAAMLPAPLRPASPRVANGPLPAAGACEPPTPPPRA